MFVCNVCLQFISQAKHKTLSLTLLMQSNQLQTYCLLQSAIDRSNQYACIALTERSKWPKVCIEGTSSKHIFYCKAQVTEASCCYFLRSSPPQGTRPLLLSTAAALIRALQHVILSHPHIIWVNMEWHWFVINYHHCCFLRRRRSHSYSQQLLHSLLGALQVFNSYSQQL